MKTLVAFLVFSVLPAFSQIVTVPFHRDNGLIFVDVVVEKETLHLLFDSGSVNTLITAKSMKVDLKLAAMNHQSYERGLEGSIVQMPVTLVFGDRKLHTDAMVGNLSKLASNLNVSRCDGILGEDVLGQLKSFRINNKTKEIELEM